MSTGSSITRRLVVTVLLLELLAGAGLVGVVLVHERHIEYRAFDANLRSSANALLGAVQEADDADNVILNAHDVALAPGSIYRVIDERGSTLGSFGSVPALQLPDGQFQQVQIEGRSFRFVSLSGERVIDPATNGGIHHHIHVLYGQPDGHVWHEVLEAVRFIALATALLLGATTLLLLWLVRRLLSPIRELAAEAEKISAASWHFTAPPSSHEVQELRPLASAIEKMMARLQRSFEQQKRFTSDAAHELKTDLAIIKSSLQLLSMKKRSAIEYEQGLALILDDFTRLEQTVRKMLTLARLEQPAEPRLQSCCLSDALEDAVHQGSPLAAMKRITIRNGPLHRATVAMDRRDALLLCSNILINALQHSPESGTIELGLSLAGSSLQCTVRDHGEGIAEEDLRHLFEPFYRGDASRSRKTGGTGLGLSICKAICDRHNGSIAITNHPEGGTLVTVLLPCHNAPAAQQLSATLNT